MIHSTAMQEDPGNTDQLLEKSLAKAHEKISSLLKKANTVVNDNDDESRVVIESKVRSLERYFDEIKIIYDYGIDK